MNWKGNTFLRDIASAWYGILGNLFTTTIAFVQCIVAALFWPVDWAGKKLVTQATRPSNSWQLLARPLSFFRTHQLYPVVYGAPFCSFCLWEGRGQQFANSVGIAIFRLFNFTRFNSSYISQWLRPGSVELLLLILGHKSEPHSSAWPALLAQHFICHRHRHRHRHLHHHHHYQQRHRHDHCHFRFCVTTSSVFDGFISLRCVWFGFVLGQRVASKS